MTPKQRTLILAAIALAAACLAAAPDKSSERNKSTEENSDRIWKLLADARIDTSKFPAEMPLAKFLEAVRRQLPGEKKIALRLEEKELGKDSARYAAAPVRCAGMRKSLYAVLVKALKQVAPEGELEFAIRPEGIVITRARLAVNPLAYDVADIVRDPFLLREWKRADPVGFEDLDSSDGVSLLIRLMAYSMDWKPWEKIDCHNGVRLIVLASPERQEELKELLAALRRLMDSAVVMNARLYEVKRDFFRKHVAPLFIADKKTGARPAIVPIGGDLLKKILQQKCVQESEITKLRAGVKQSFFSRQSVFRFTTRPNGRREKGSRSGTGLSGFAFDVYPIVSVDRLAMRLRITQHVSRLVGMEKSKMLDPDTDKEVEFDVPKISKSSRTETVVIHDEVPIVMVVDYRPPGKEGEDKVWLLVARPYIWNEAEAKESGRQLDEAAAEVWRNEVPKEKAPAK